MVDILKHQYIPRHTILKKEEVDELLKTYNVSIKQLPKILSNDPVVKLISAKIGDVIMIKRKSYTAKESVYYRAVVNA